MHSPIHWFFRLKVQCYLKALFWTLEAAFEKPVSMWYQTFRQKSIKRAPQVTGYHWVPFSIDSFQGWGNMKLCKKSFDRFRNLLIILSRLCYTFIHSISIRFVIFFFCNSIIPKPLVSCYFYASYYWIFKVHRHILMCEVWVNNLQRKGKLSWKRSKSV